MVFVVYLWGAPFQFCLVVGLLWRENGMLPTLASMGLTVLLISLQVRPLRKSFRLGIVLKFLSPPSFAGAWRIVDISAQFFIQCRLCVTLTVIVP